MFVSIKLQKNGTSWSFQAFLNTQREIPPEVLQSNRKNIMIPLPLIICTGLMQNGFYDLQVAFMNMCLHGYAGFVDRLHGCVICAVTDDSVFDLMFCCYHLNFSFA